MRIEGPYDSPAVLTIRCSSCTAVTAARFKRCTHSDHCVVAIQEKPEGRALRWFGPDVIVFMSEGKRMIIKQNDCVDVRTWNIDEVHGLTEA